MSKMLNKCAELRRLFHCLFHGLQTIMSIKHSVIDNIPSKREKMEYYFSLNHASTINLCREILKMMQKELFQSDNPEMRNINMCHLIGVVHVLPLVIADGS